MDGDDERTDKESERSQPASPQNNSKTNTAIITDSSSGENGNQQRADGRRRRSRRNQRNNNSKPSKSFNRDHIRQKLTSRSHESSKEDPSVPAQRRKRRRRNHQRKYKPYTKLSWEERIERDEAESLRATRQRANRPTPYNTTQFLMEDHKADTPDLSGLAENHDNDPSEEIFEEDFRNGEYLEKNFTAVYDEVQSERLQSMSKEQLVNEVLALAKKVTELEDTQRKLKSDHEIKCEDNRGEKTVASVQPLRETLMGVPYLRLRKEVEKPIIIPEKNL